MKCVITGPPEAGKSSLKRRLHDQTLPQTYWSTGIANSPDVVFAKSVTQQSSSLSSNAWSPRTPQELSQSLITSACSTIHELIEESVPPLSAEDPTTDIHVPGINVIALKKLNEAAKGYSQSEGVTSLLSIIDTGGQPELRELLPAFITGPAINIIVFRMDKGLDERYLVRYRSKDVHSSYQSSVTHKDMIFSSLGSIACLGKNTDGAKFSTALRNNILFIIGTHKDKMSDSDMQAINDKIREVIGSGDVCDSNLVMYHKEAEPVYMVNNRAETCDVTQNLKERIVDIVNSCCEPITISVAWFSFQLELKKICNHVQSKKYSYKKYKVDRVISTDICYEIAQECGIKCQQDMFDALTFLHHIGSVMYFPEKEELNKIVIIDVQVIFDCITELINSCGSFDKTKDAAANKHLRNGIFFIDNLQKIIDYELPAVHTTSKKFKLTSSNLKQTKRLPKAQHTAKLNCKQIMAILLHLNTIAEVTIDDSRRRFFMPCALKPAYIEDDVHPPGACNAPLLVCFKCGYCPVGVFTSLIAYLMKGTSSKTCQFKWELDSSVSQCRNKLQFKVGPCKDIVTLISRPTHYEIRVDRQFHVVLVPLSHVCSQIRSNIHDGIKTVTKTLNYNYNTEHYFGYYCTCTVSSLHPAVCEYYDPQNCVVATCTRDKGHNFTLDSMHKVWLGEVGLHST